VQHRTWEMPPRTGPPDTASEASSGASDATPTFWDSLNRFNDVRLPLPPLGQTTTATLCAATETSPLGPCTQSC
jgi:hypothetical protein